MAASRRNRPAAAVFWRRRVVAAGLALCCLGIARQAGAAFGGTTLAASDARPPVVVTYVVQPGDTLWSIAERIAPDEDPRSVVDELRDARDSDVLYPGETIRFVAE